MLASQHVETFDSKFFLCIPYLPNDTNGLNMVSLREFLQMRGRLCEAGLILNFELGFQPNQAHSQKACRSFLEACSSSAARQESVWYVESKARLHLAKLLNRQDQQEQAAKEFELAKNLLQQAPVPATLNRTEVSVRFVELQSHADTNPRHSLRKWTEFAESLSETEDSSELCSTLEKVTAAAHEILEGDASDENHRKIFWESQSREESILERLGDFYTIYLHRTTHSTVDYSGAGETLKWQRDFQLNHPKFCIWNLKILQLRLAMFIYQHLKDKDNVFKMLCDIRDLKHHRDVFWSNVDECYTLQTEIGLDEVPDLGDEERTNEAFRPDGMRKTWRSEWDKELSVHFGMYKNYVVNEGDTELKREDASLKTLLRWLKSGSSSEELSKTDLERILLPTCDSLLTGSRIQSFKGVFVKRKAAENEDEEAEVDVLLGELNPTLLGIQVFGTEECPPSSDYWQDAFSVLRDWLFQRAKYDERKRHTLLVDLQIQMLWKVSDTGSLTQQALEAQRILDLIPTLCTEARQNQLSGVWRNVLCDVKRAALVAKGNAEALFEDHPNFREITELYEITLNESHVRRKSFMQAVTSASLAAHYSFAAWNLRPEAIEQFFRYCNLAEQWFQRIRESWKLLRGWEKVEKLTLAVDESIRHRMAASAVIILSRFPDSAGLERDHRIWTTIQKEKSWGLGWLMQTNSLHGVEGTPIAKNATSDFNALPVITLDDLQSIGGGTENGVVYVDWYDGRNNTLGPDYSPNVLLLTVSDGESPKSWHLDITWKKVDDIVKKFLECNEEDFLNGDARKLLRKLNPLVQPLRQVSRPGQLLVFSAVGDLHCIPLHALEIDKEFLIRRNPIVYSSSVTVLNVVCQERKKYEKIAKDDGRRFGLSLCLGEIPSVDGKESQDSLVEMFAMKGFNDKPLKDDTFTSEKFKNTIQRPGLDLFHYHGHANFEETDPLCQSLAFKDGHFNLQEVFELAPVPTSYHATLLGCGSGKSKTTTSNDVIGLVSAFLYSGASSTVSALWTKIDDKDAAIYSKHFYSHFEHALDNSDGPRVINLATAHQKAVLKIMEEQPKLYHWAPFVLNGYWMYHIPLQNAEP